MTSNNAEQYFRSNTTLEFNSNSSTTYRYRSLYLASLVTRYKPTMYFGGTGFGDCGEVFSRLAEIITQSSATTQFDF